MSVVVSVSMEEAAVDLVDLLVHRGVALSRTDLVHKALCEFSERYPCADRLRAQVLKDRDWLPKRQRLRPGTKALIEASISGRMETGG